MSLVTRSSGRLAAAAAALVVAGSGALAPSAPGARESGPGGTGGAPIAPGGVAPNAPPGSVPPPAGRHAKGRWLSGVTITEYWPAPESWFVGRLVRAPGIPGLHHIDWLYSAQGISMQGDGIGLDGQTYHIQALGRGGWVTAAGAPTEPEDGWSAGAPYWRAGGYWRGPHDDVTFPLAAGGWSAGRGRRYVPLRGVRFATGPPLSLRYWQSIAVDPTVIPLGSRVYVPAYRDDGHGGWFLAQDTGGAIIGRHIDVYRSPPASPLDSAGGLETAQRIFVIAPRRQG